MSARQQPVAVGARDQLPLRDELVVGHRRRRAERRGQPALDRRGIECRLGVQHRVGQRQEQLLAGTQLRHADVDAAVGQHPSTTSTGHVPSSWRASSSPPTVSPMSWLSSASSFDPELGGERHDDVRLLGERVRLVGLRREPVAEEVEQEHAAGAAQIVEHAAKSYDELGNPWSTSNGSSRSASSAGATNVKIECPARSRRSPLDFPGSDVQRALPIARARRERRRQLGPAAHAGPVRVLDHRVDVDLEVGQPLQDLRDHLGELEARQVGAHAAVDAHAERQMPVRVAVDHERVGVGERVLVAARRRSR